MTDEEKPIHEEFFKLALPLLEFAGRCHVHEIMRGLSKFPGGPDHALVLVVACPACAQRLYSLFVAFFQAADTMECERTEAAANQAAKGYFAAQRRRKPK